MKRVLALEFDGVIWDSVGECFVMARRASEYLYGLRCADLESAFRRGRWLARSGGDFLLILQLAMKDPEGDLGSFSKAEFTALQQARAQECAEFALEFYQLRDQSREKQWSDWASYQQPYPLFLHQIPELQHMFDEIVICTTKDEASARSLLASAGLEPAIWGREHGIDKGAQVRDLCKTREIEPEQVFFIDDLLENLQQVAAVGARCGLAAWGYNTAEERQAAQAAGFPVLEVYSVARDIRELLKSECPAV